MSCVASCACFMVFDVALRQATSGAKLAKTSKLIGLFPDVSAEAQTKRHSLELCQ